MRNWHTRQMLAASERGKLVRQVFTGNGRGELL